MNQYIPLAMKYIIIPVILLFTLTGYTQPSLTIHFGFDKFQLSRDAQKKLDSFLVAEKEKISSRVIQLNGYCDATGTDNYNRSLSLKRVLTVKNYLLRYGIEPGAIGSISGHGESDQLNGNRTEEERRQNRRVEISFFEVIQTNPPGSEQLKSLLEQIADTATKAGTTIVLKNINFYGGTPFPLPESFETMDELLQTMKVNYNLVIEVRGHICCIPTTGDSEYRETGNGLSEERARTIYAYLTGNGIEESRVSYKGFGHSMPIYPFPEQSEEERVANRRVEIKVIRK
ncbi:MAG: OmpA family protein [Chitinophagaceae bacterium]|nr:OmpA family protein [Chitinophagaceae bacterium]